MKNTIPTNIAITRLLILLTTGLFSIQAVSAQKVSSDINIQKKDVLTVMEKVADWQLQNPTGKKLNTWEYAPFYAGIMQLYKLTDNGKYFNELMEMGEKVNWTPRPRPYDANVFAISQVFYELFEITGENYMIDKSDFMLDMPMARNLKNEVAFDGNKYWWEYWTWCDALFMAPPAYARKATMFGQPKYMEYMVKTWWEVSDYLYSKEDSLYYRDDRFFTLKSKSGGKIFWSRGNGWVIGGLTRLLDYMPKDYPGREKFEQQFIEMCSKLSKIPMENGFWSQSLLDAKNYPQKESSGTGFFLHGIAWGINNGLLSEEEFMPVIEKGWKAIIESVYENGKFGYVQEVGDSPTNVKREDTESYGIGAFLLAGCEIYKLLDSDTKTSAQKLSPGQNDRNYTIGVLRRLADPIFIPLSENKLHEVIPRRDWETRESNIHTSAIQAFGRTLSGMAPWLSLGVDDTREGKLRGQYIDLSVKSMINATDPKSPDYMFSKHTVERVVHAAYLAYPLLVASDQLWDPMSKKEKNNVIKALETHRLYPPFENNWLLFSAITECAIWKFTGKCNFKAIEKAINKHMDEWYLGDGTYGDGPDFNWNYYNSYVIHPLLLETLFTCKELGHELGNRLPTAKERGMRYAEVLEHQISPEGTYPIIGRSSVYRFAAFKQLGYMAFRWDLPESLKHGATRAALTSVIRHMTEAPGTFAEDGWLNAGVVGKQEEARDYYNYTGALYMCSMGLTHLGIPADAPFWTDEPGKWFQKQVWDGDNIPKQEAYEWKKDPK